jgi:ribosomal protein L37AE/L43A
MVHSSPSSPPRIAVLDDEPDVARLATCPMCHTQASLTQHALDTGSAWRCVRCGQHWDGGRLSAVAAYAVWVARDGVNRLSAAGNQETGPHLDPVAERQDGTP